MLWTVAILATAVSLVAHLTLRFETVRLSHEVNKAHRKKREYIDDCRLLSLEIATLSKPDRIESVARDTFGMNPVQPSQIVRFSGGSHGKTKGGTR